MTGFMFLQFKRYPYKEATFFHFYLSKDEICNVIGIFNVKISNIL